MMEYEVAKPFSTVDTRFREVGKPVTRDEIRGAVSFDTWVERGFIRRRGEAAAAKPAAKPFMAPKVKDID